MSNGSFENNESGTNGGGLALSSGSGAAAELKNVTISGNKAYSGAGIYSAATLKLEDVTIRYNSSTGGSSSAGGGMYTLGGTVTMTRVTLERNTAFGGGAASLNNTNATLKDVMVNQNTVTGNGGGLVVSGSTLTAMNVIVAGNEASHAGGLFLSSLQSATLTNVLINGNKTTGNGGGVYFQGQGNYTLTNVTISGNAAAKGGGFYQNLSGTGEVIVRNSIVWGNDATEGKDVSKPGGHLGLAYSLIEGSGGTDEWNDAFGENLGSNIDADPLFADAKPAGEAPSTEGDYRLTNSSPAIDAGDDGVFEDDATPDLSGISTDLAGKPRKRYDAVDMGAYEFLDETAPSITDKTPASSAENVATDVKLVLKFDEPVKPVAGKMIKVWTSEDTVAADSVATAATVNGTTVTITLSSKLSNDTEYYVTIDQGAFVDRADHEVEAIADKTAWTFTTAAADDEPGDDEPGNGGSPSPSQPANPSPSQPAPTAPAGVDVLVNGKAESAGTLETGTRDGRAVATVTLDENRLEERLAEEGRGTVVTVPVSAGSEIVVGELNGRMVKMMEASEAILEIRTDRAAYTLPASQIRIDALSELIGSEVALQDIKVQIEIAEPAAVTVQAVESAAADGSFTLVVPPIEFTVRAVHGDTIIEVEKFTAYVERLVSIPEGADPERITTAVVVDPDGTVRHVPTRVELIDGRYYAKVNSLTNSTYAVIWNPVEFTDVRGHWAKSAVNNLGSRKIMEGVGGGLFEPARIMTRAEFAATIVRALGLKPEAGAAPFTDVRESDWHNGYILTAWSYGLITGSPDGAFRPDERITREQAMAVLARAMELTNLKAKLPEAADGEVPLAFADADQVSGWAKAAIADNVRAGIVTGRNGTELAPKAFVTRAEVVVMVQRLLRKSDLI
jgi:hypothetical protein